MTAQILLPLAAFAAHLNQHPDQPNPHQPRQDNWTTFSYAQVDKEARSIASALQAREYQKGDRIGILAKNSAQWVMADLAIMMAGMISVPIYATAGTKTIDYVLQHSEVKALFVGKLDSTDAIQNIETKVTTVCFDYQGVIATDHKWSDWVNDHQPLAQVPEYQPADTLSIVYTSGSTGVPKGVIISHRNAVAVVAAVSEYLPEGEIRVLSYLPMAHITERAIVAMTSFYNDMQIFFNESLETFPADLQHAKVTVFISVPRLWTKFRAMVLAGMPDEQLQAVLKTEQDPTVAAQIRAKLGLAQCKFFGSGAAPISGALLQWYENLGMPIEEGWGMTELNGLACNSAPYDKANVGTIGTACPGFDIRLSDAGEIQIKGPAVFEGYYLNEEITRDSFDDGWFKTGDLGEFTVTGALKIVGRVKEQCKTAKG